MLIHKAEAAPVVVLLKSQVCWARDRGSLLVVPLSKEPPPLMGGGCSRPGPLGWLSLSESRGFRDTAFRLVSPSSSFPVLWLFLSEALRELGTKQDAELRGQDRVLFPRL